MIIFFPCIVLHQIAVLNRNRIALHRNSGESYRIASCFICIFNVSYRWLCIEIRIALASVMEMDVPNSDSDQSNIKDGDIHETESLTTF